MNKLMDLQAIVIIAINFSLVQQKMRQQVLYVHLRHNVFNYKVWSRNECPEIGFDNIGNQKHWIYLT